MKSIHFAAVGCLAMAAPVSAAVNVSASNSTPTFIGNYAAGSYAYSVSGVASLAGPVGSGFDVDASGKPTSPVTHPAYDYFNQNGGATNDYGRFGPAGSAINLGELALTKDPNGTSGFFSLKTLQSLSFASAVSLYALVNDTYYSNNDGGFTLSVPGGTQPMVHTTVSSSNSTPTLLYSFQPGTYRYSVAGTVSLAGPAGSGFDVDAAGRPVTPVTYAGYGYFNESGADNDFGNLGPAGKNRNLGSLVGSYGPAGNGEYFSLGTGGTLTFTKATDLYGLVNDTYYSNNSGVFAFTAAPVPEPGEWAMMLAGLGVVGGVVARRRRQAAA